ncbi:hypothetical protein ABID82_004987 [Methylobacterium sp. PvP062]|jgi:hypothetical protein|uniref:GIY-YIG nuclease family protein n=1 Tax=Methylobacterium radiotolerans TaxID=31998 RepID=A0ABV2NP32_9HYPH|nr:MULTISPECIES: hypothetical protein [unclassified Methylobacterium]MBP2495028.1 hypothetical protein [Methylobacterium sp. PvP105]MBP2505101.1 hypothetical protein [Methylobacterium sp. PvP109]MCX7331337.1 hypothetical protein [Hyphomicrobiales bacterium]
MSGVKWRKRQYGMVAYWLPTPVKRRQGYRPKSVLLYSGPDPDEAVIADCRKKAEALTMTMRAWRPEGPVRPTQGVIYFMRLGDHVKIGFTLDLEKRIFSLKTGSPVLGQLVGILKGTREIDRFVRWLFRASHFRGDWFHPTPELLAFIEAHATLPPPAKHKRAERKPTW